MRAIETILVAMDWSLAAMDAWREACFLAQTLGARLILAHALPPEVGGEDGIRRRAEELLRDLSAGAPVTTLVESGPTVDVLINAARERRADLVVLGAGEKTALGSLLLGRTAERVVAESPAPVWLVRPGRPHTGLKAILCATDDGPAARLALAEALFLCRTFAADLTLVTALPDPEAPLLPGLPRRTSDGRERAAGEALLAGALARLDHHGLRIERRVRLGKPAPAIIEAAEQTRCDLLVMGTAGRGGLPRLWHGSTAERVVRAVPCSTLVVRAPRTI